MNCCNWSHPKMDFHLQESAYPSMTTSFYKFGLSDFGNNISYYDHSPSYDGSNHEPCAEEYRRASENSPSMSNEETVAMNVEWEGNANSTSRENPVDCKFRSAFGDVYNVTC